MHRDKLGSKPVTVPADAIEPQPAGRLSEWLPPSQFLSIIVLAASLFIANQLWEEARNNAEQALQSDFDFLVRESNRRIEQRMQTYEQVLRGAVGLFAASGNVRRRDFHAYVNTLQLTDRYPGIQGIGFSIAVPPPHKTNHIAAVRNEGFPDYTIKPEGKRDVYTSILYLEPFSDSNLRAFGYDMYTEAVRRAAMQQARDSGQPAVSGKVTLIQEAGHRIQTGFLLYLPVYRNGTSNDTVSERRANCTGWIFALFRISDLMAGLLGEKSDTLDITIYDGTNISGDALMHGTSRSTVIDQPPTRFVRTHLIKIGGHDWTVITRAQPDFEQQSGHDRALFILKAGIAASILLTLLAWLLVDDRARALQAARQALRLALYDILTDLPNRKLFTDRLLQTLEKAKRDQAQVAVMFIDLDKFKPVNDAFGHAVGDLLLKEVANRLEHCVRKSDTVARLGGDEFVVLLPYVQENHGDRIVAGKILKALSDPFPIAGHALHISSSIGIAVYPQDGDTEKLLLKNADTAMYHAKKNGRNNVQFFHPGMQEIN